MALTLTQNFETNLDLNQIKLVIKNDLFQKERIKDSKVISFESSANTSTVTIKKLLEIELASNISAMVSNPFEIIESWDLENASKILVLVEIPKVQTKIMVELTVNDQHIIEVKSQINSTVFMMGSFVEEHVAKFWKKIIDKDLKILLSWPINQI